MDKLEIVMAIPGLQIAGDTLDKASLGGSETMGLQMAFALAEAGQYVRVFGNVPGVHDHRDVSFQSISDFPEFSRTTPHDICIVQRAPDLFRSRIASKLNFLWCHDLPLGRQADEFRGVLWNVDRVSLLSQFMTNAYRQVYQLDEESIHQTRNGIDTVLLPEWTPSSGRMMKRLVCGARPERGVDNFVGIMKRLLEKDPEITLALCGYQNQVDHLRAFYEGLANAFAQFGERVSWQGHLTKRDLYKLYSESALYVYPTPSAVSPDFSEVFCISAVEAQACGLPVVASDRGALCEVVGAGAGDLIQGDPWTDQYQDAMVEKILSYLNDHERWSEASRIAHKNAVDNYSMNTLAKEWISYFHETIAAMNESPDRLARHFYRTNDIQALRALAAKDTDGAIDKGFLDRVLTEYSFTETPEAFAAHYIKNGKDTTDRLKTAPVALETFTENTERRFGVIADTLRRAKGVETVLEYGCGHGWSTLYYQHHVGKRWFGVDIDPGAVETARGYAEKFGKDKKALRFAVADENTIVNSVVNQMFLSDEDGTADWPWDCGLISEVLEHAVDPYKVVEAVEELVKPGGLMIITVPYGPSEFATPNWTNFRNHLWNFDVRDLKEMFGAKKDVATYAAFDHLNVATGEPCGFYIVTYTADQKPLGRIDMERKLSLQRPRLSVSACLISGNGAEQTLGWCLESIRWVVDEIVIGDTGMNDEGRAIAAKFGARVVKVSNPIETGFDAPRNETLDHCKCDMILWLDTDERMLDPINLTKYYRQSVWNGFSIRQHHFSIDANFQPDMPVRLFRRAPYKGAPMRWYGRIHEHPELGMNNGPGPVLVVGDVNIAHVGYLAESGRRTRFWRNYPLLQKDIQDYPNRVLQKHFIMRDLCLLNKYDYDRNGNVLTPEMQERARQVVKLYREHFLGKTQYANLDSLEYYTQAMTLLGEGIDVSFAIHANRQGRGDKLNGGTIGRFASVEEAKLEIGKRLEDRMQPLVNPLW